MIILLWKVPAVVSIWTEQTSGATTWAEQLTGQPSGGWSEKESAVVSWGEQLTGQPVGGWTEKSSPAITWTEQ